MLFGAEDPIGREIIAGRDDSPPWTIAGVVGNIRGSELGAEPQPLIYRCLCQSTSRFLSLMHILVRTGRDPQAAIRAVEGQVYSIDPSQPVFDVQTMDQRLAGSLAPRRFQLLLTAGFAAIAIILAMLGVYGVMSYLVHLRTHEIGVRMALGARPAEVLRLVVGESAALAFVAVLAGLAGASALTRYLHTMLYGVTALDRPTFFAMPLLLAAAAIAASVIPARRAARIHPAIALRDE